jgi:hypothetical protein
MEELITLDDASLEREKQRSESEARDIIHDLDRLYTFPEERKTRWVWEFLQNAKDVADPNGVDIAFKLTNDELTFTHNGLPFATKHLLALLYKTSTKSLTGEGGTTGKYGTGFVTTHILNRKLKISGVHENDSGKRHFELLIDRSACSLDESKALDAMQKSLAKTFLDIDKVTKTQSEEIKTNKHSFTYELTDSSYIYAEKGLLELERNIAFTLLINSKIKSITIETSNNSTRHVASTKQTSIGDLKFINSSAETGVLYYSSDKLLIGIPVKEKGDSYQLLPIQNQAILFKEFPLIGTEKFNLPVLIQHSDSHPTEQRDGIRTKKESETEDDPTADKNRKTLIEFVNAYLPFVQKLIDAKLEDIHLLAKSGLPALVENYSNISWYQANVQGPIRKLILDNKVVKTCSGSFVRIEHAKFPDIAPSLSMEFYSLLSRLLPDQVPELNSIFNWSEIVAQEPSEWPKQITIDHVELVRLVPEHIDVNKEDSFSWLIDLYKYLDTHTLTGLGKEYPIYLNEANRFCLRNQVSIHPVIDYEFKVVSKGLGRPLDEEFLNRKLGEVSAIKPFDLAAFYNYLNKELIGEQKIESATPEQIKAIFYVCCLFRSERAFKKEQWFSLINQLLPKLAPEKKQISVDYEYYGRSAELWTVKYVSYLIEKTERPTAFAASYFEGHMESCFVWLNAFLSYIFSLKEDNSEVILKREILPTQSDRFKPYQDNIFAERDSKYFDDVIKNIYRDHTGKGDPRVFLIDTRIMIEEIRTKEVDVLTTEIDKIFLNPNIEINVKKGGKYNEMFLQLNNWFEQFSNAENYLRTFSSKRATLYVLALGEGFSKQIMAIQNSGKSIEDIAELAKINLSPQEMKLFEAAVSKLGADQLLAKAQEMIAAKEQIERWKTIGTAAETAFREALATSEPSFEILNPDIGKDFVIKANGKEYAIEIKSVDPLKGNVNMSLLQGVTAEREKDRYALAVLSRPTDDQPVDKDYFINVAQFVPDIGCQIGNTIADWSQGLRSLDTQAEVKVSLDDKTESVYVSRNIWKQGISFSEFVINLNDYFSLDETNR